MTSPLPPPSPNQPHVTVSPLPAGFLTLPDTHFIHPVSDDLTNAKRTVPSLAFLITHPGPLHFHNSPTDTSKPFHLMFDLGLRKSRERYPEVLRGHLETRRRPFCLEPGVAGLLLRGGSADAAAVQAEDVGGVVLSHVHYDHHGDPEDFPNAQFRVGKGSMDVLQNGLGGGGGAASHQHFEADILPAGRSAEFSDPWNEQEEGEEEGGEWKPLGPFDKALDLFRDGSVYIIDMPGHLPGHVNMLCRMETRWVMLCGDAFHDPRLLTGEKEIGTWEGPQGVPLCIHVDKEVAAESIGKLRRFDEETGDECELIAAHDEVWWERNQHKAYPGVL